MEWAALLTWALVAPIGMFIAMRAAAIIPSLGVQAVAAATALVLSLLFVVLGDEPPALEWAAFGVGLAGFTAVTAGGARLMVDDRDVSPAGQAAEEVAALLTPAQIALYATAAFFTLLAALGIDTVM